MRKKTLTAILVFLISIFIYIISRRDASITSNHKVIAAGDDIYCSWNHSASYWDGQANRKVDAYECWLLEIVPGSRKVLRHDTSVRVEESLNPQTGRVEGCLKNVGAAVGRTFACRVAPHNTFCPHPGPRVEGEARQCNAP